MNNKTTIQVEKDTLFKLKRVGAKGETYNDIILRLLKEAPNGTRNQATGKKRFPTP